jgi:GNAT superfamily N-acetyltransferase
METDSTAPALFGAGLEIRAVRFEDVPEILRVVTRAVDRGCRDHYDQAQQAAVVAAYASALFLEWRGPYETVVAEAAGRIVGFAQLDPADARLRALFVDADLQGRGVGRALLADVEARAAGRGCRRVHGAMSLNAVPFYERAGFRARGGVEPLSSVGVAVPIVRMEKVISRRA